MQMNQKIIILTNNYKNHTNKKKTNIILFNIFSTNFSYYISLYIILIKNKIKRFVVFTQQQLKKKKKKSKQKLHL
jgi:hypothetical protein